MSMAVDMDGGMASYVGGAGAGADAGAGSVAASAAAIDGATIFRGGGVAKKKVAVSAD